MSKRAPSFVFFLLLAPFAALGQTPREPVRTDGPWFGVHLPPAFGAEPAVIVGERPARPFVLPKDAKDQPEFAATRLRSDLETIVGFSKDSRTQREVGQGQLWGRISGLPSGARAIEWAHEQFRAAGIADVKMQDLEQESRASLWLPQSWEVRLLADPAFGAGSTDVVLESAMPLAPSQIPGETLTAPLVYVGTATAAVIDHIDVKGKIAVQLVVPQGHMVFERGAATPRAQELMKRGAVAVLNLVRLPGNERSFDLGNCGGPCFNLGGRDGLFVETILDRAARAGLNDRVRAQLKLIAAPRTGLKAHNSVAVIPGKRTDEAIIIDSHADAWFDGAGDNADGLAVTIALARHFAKPANRPARTLIFIASAGHHSAGLNGPRNFMRANPELAKNSVLMINVEHVAQRNFSPARTLASDGYRQSVADVGEAPIVFGISNGAPVLNALAERAVARYGVNFISETSTMSSGETGGFADLNGAKVTIMQAPPLYHTSGETLDVISTPGMQRMAYALAEMIREVAKAPTGELRVKDVKGTAD
jgi:hypothetical protein